MTDDNIEELHRRLLDPDFDVSENGYHIIETVSNAVSKGVKRRVRDAIVNDLLLRIRHVSPWVFAITVGQFRGFYDVEQRWREHEYKDSRGFTWLAPMPFDGWRKNGKKEDDAI